MESPLRRFREKQGTSQRKLAEESGISRGRLRRLEGPDFEQATFDELRRISAALGVEVEKLFEGILPDNRACLRKSGNAAFEMDYPDLGFKIVSFLPPRDNFFIGKLFIRQRRRLLADQTPRAKTIFIQTLLGSVKVEAKGSLYEIAEGDSLFFPGDLPYALENPIRRDSVVLFFTLPSFKSP